MIKLEDNKSRFKWYRCNLPRYTVIDSGIKLSDSMPVRIYNDNISKDVMDYLKSFKYLTNISYSIADNDLFTTPARVFIDEDTKIYIGRIDWAANIPEIWNSVMLLIMYDMTEIVKTLYEEVDHQINWINKGRTKHKLVNINVDLVEDKSIDFIFKSDRIDDKDRGKVDAEFKYINGIGSHRLRYHATINSYKHYNDFIN